MDYNNENESITDKLLSLDILEKIKRSKPLISISLPNSDDVFLSMILDVDDQLKSITIDGLKPDKGHSLLSKSKALSIETHLRGIPVQFNTVLLKTDNKKNLISYQIKFPEKIDYFQKRKEHRVTISIGLHVDFYIRTNKQWLKIGRLTDISTGGIGLLTNEKEKNFINQLPAPIMSKIQFGASSLFHFEINLCHTLYDENSGRYQIGTRFEGLSLQDVNKLSKIIRTFDRDNVKKETRQAL